MTAELDEDRFNMAIRKFLKHVGVTSQREIENLVRSGEVKGGKLKLRMTLSAEGTPPKPIAFARLQRSMLRKGRDKRAHTPCRSRQG